MGTTKIYSIEIEMGQAREQLAAAGQLLADLKTKAAAANQEAKETKTVYQENAAALRELVAEQKRLEAARKGASAGQPAVAADAALNKNLAAQQQLNKTVQESKVVYQDAKAAADAAGAAVGKQAGAVKDLTGSVKEYGAAAKAAAQEFAPGTFGAIGQEIERLKAELQDLVPGSAEAAAAIQALSGKESELRKLAQATAAANPEAQAKAFGLLTQAVTGVVGVSLTAAQAFGLSEQTAQQYTQKMQALIGVLYSVDAVNRLLNGENLSLVKSIVSGGKAWLGFGTAAEAGSKAARIGLASTGVGLIVLALGALIALWMDFGSTVKSSESTFTKYKATVIGGFDAIIAVVKDVVKAYYQLYTFDFSGLKKTFNNLGKDTADAYAKGRAGVINEAQRAEIAHEVEKQERLLKINQAAGVDTDKLQRQILEGKIAAQKQGSKEEQDAIAELASFNKTVKKKEKEDTEALTLARLNAVLGLEQAAGKEVYRAQLAAENQKLQALQNAAKPEKAAIEAQQSVIANLTLAHEKELNEKLFAAKRAGLEGRIALAQQKGEDAFQTQLRLEQRSLAHLLAAGTQDAAAIQQQKDKIALLNEAHDQELEQKRRQVQILSTQNVIELLEKEGKDTLGLRLENAERLLSLDKDGSTKERAQRDADLQALLVLQTEYNVKMRGIKEAQQQQAAGLEESGKEAERAFIEAGLDYSTQVYNDSLAKRAPDLGLKLIKNFFGLDGEKAQALKQIITEAAAEIMGSLGQLAGALLDGATQDAQQRLEAAQQQLSDADAALSAASSARQADTDKLASATGARRDYLISKISAESKAEERLAAQKTKAAADVKKQQEEQHRLQKIGMELTAASTLATNVAAASSAVYAGINAVAGASAVPFPASIPAIALALTTVIAAVASAKQLQTASKFADGGVVGEDGVLQGPSHAQGGIAFTVAGRPGFEAEGGEHLTPVGATQRNGPLLQMLRTEGRSRTLGPLDFLRLAQGAQGMAQSIKAAPASYFEAGGLLNKSGVAGGFASAVSVTSLQAEQQRTNVLLAQLLTAGATTAAASTATAKATTDTAAHTSAIKDFGPPRIVRGPQEVLEDQQTLQEINAAKRMATL